MISRLLTLCGWVCRDGVSPGRGPVSFTRLLAGLVLSMLGAVSLAQQAATVSPGAIPAARQAQNLVIITIKGGINSVTARSIERRIRVAEQAGADGIIIDLNTPGGEVGAVLDICRTIRTSSIPNTIAWVNPTAYSAAYPNCDISSADTNQDGIVSVGDIAAFVSILTGP